jgi:uncharacterized protein YicC (UPF0701 family)
MMLSMTGFGEGSSEVAAGTARVAIATVNHKGTAITVRGDLRDLALEEQIRDEVRRAIGRGAATVQIAWEPTAVAGIDRLRVAAAWRELAAIAGEVGAPPPRLGDALALVGRGRDDPAQATPAVQAALAQALERLRAARAREGAAQQAVLTTLASRLRGLHGQMTALAAPRVGKVRERLAALVAEAVGRAVPPEVLAREIAIEAQRIDVAEELARLAAHLDALDRLLARTDPIGRELDFLAQEFGREANTCAAKANDATLSERCIEAKVLIDQIKEQAANVL